MGILIANEAEPRHPATSVRLDQSMPAETHTCHESVTSEDILDLFEAVLTGARDDRSPLADRRLVLVGIADDLAVLDPWDVTIDDDRLGFRTDDVREEALGLLGMRERLALVGGTLEIESSPEAGTTIAVEVPVLTAL